MPVSSKFYNIFWNNPQCQSIFLLHREQLLERGEIKLKSSSTPFYLQRVVLSNSLKRKDSFQRIEQRIKNRDIEAEHTLTTIGTKNIDEEKMNRYFNEKFGKSFALISQKVGGSSFSQIAFASEITRALFSEKKLLSFLHKYNFIPQEIETFKALQGHFEQFVEKEVSSILNSKNIVDLHDFLGQIIRYYDNYTFTSLIAADKFYTDVLYDKENYKSITELFDSLYESGALIGGQFKTYYECTNCNVGTFSGNMTLNVAPSKVKLKCPNCNKDVFYLAPYKIDDSIFDDIMFKDGLIHGAVKSLMTSLKIPNIPNGNLLNDVELDFQILNKEGNIIEIVETKMFKTDRPEDVIATNIQEGVRKLIKAREKLISSNSNYANVHFHYLTNVTNEKTLQEVVGGFRNELLNVRFSFHTISSFKKYAIHISHNYE